MKKFLFILATTITLFSSCKKDNDDNDDPSARTKENLSANYVLVSASAKIGVFEQDITNNEDFIPACTKDDVLTLKTDFTVTSTDAGQTCSPSSSFSGTWSLPNENTIIIDGEEFTIMEFDGRNLKLSTNVDTPLGQATVITNLRKQ